MKSFFFSMVAVLGMALSSPLWAADTATCSALHSKLSARHAKVMTNRARSVNSIHQAMLISIENELFDAIDKCPHTALLFALMGEVQITLGQPSLATAYGYRAQKLDSASWQGFYVTGTALCLVGKHDECFAQLYRAVVLAPDNPHLQLNLCSLQVWAQRYQDAERTCSGIIDNGAQELQAQAYFLRGRARQALGAESQANADLEQAARLGFSPERDLLQIIDPASLAEDLAK